MKDRPYDGYRAFEYLDDGDYDGVEVYDRTNYGDPYEVPVDPEEQRRVERIAEEYPIVSLHDHPISLPADIADYPRYTRIAWMKNAYERIAASPLDAAFVSNLGARTWDEVTKALGICYADVAHSDIAVQAGSVEDILAAKKAGQIGFIPAFETSMAIENKLHRLDVLYGLGVRSLGITYNESNTLGTGLGDPRNGGLTEFGHEAVDRMNKLGILVDVSHASDQTARDVCAVSDDPVIASHNGAQALLDIPRLDPDDVLEAVAETGGLIGIQSAPHTTATENHSAHDVYGVMQHFEYVRDLVGIDHVTFGPDLMYGDHYGLHTDYFEKDMDQFPDWLETDIDHTRGMDNPTEGWWNVLRWLVSEGYSDEEIRKVVGGNTLRVLESVWSES